MVQDDLGNIWRGIETDRNDPNNRHAVLPIRPA